MNTYYFKLIIFIGINQLNCHSADVSSGFKKDEPFSCVKDNSQCRCEPTRAFWGGDVISVECSSKGLSYIPEITAQNKYVMYLDNNEIEKLTLSMLNGLEDLWIFSIKSNKIKIIEDRTFSHMSHLGELYLDNNEIEKLTLSMLNGLEKLSVFSIQSNKIKIIEDRTFSHMSSLSKLYLDNNEIEKLTLSMLNGLEKLLVFSIQSNKIKIIEDRTFSRMSSLSELYLDNNEIMNLTPRMFSEVKYVVVEGVSNGMDIGAARKRKWAQPKFPWLHDRTETISIPEVFHILKKLRVFSITSNEIKSIEEDTFKHMSNLRELYLDKNQIMELTPKMLNGLSNLQKFSIKSNKITIIKHNTFSHMSNLRELNLDYNEVTKLTPKMLDGLKELRIFSIKFNKITIIEDNTFSHINNLLCLYLDYNKITKLIPGMLNGLNHLQNFSITSNEITTIEDNTYSHLNSLSILYLDNNKITKLTPRMLNGLNYLQNFSITSNEITIMEDNTYSHLNNLSVLNLDNNKITKLTPGMLNGLKELWVFSMKSNEITNIEDNTFSYMNNLLYLYLSDNKIHELRANTFQNLRELRSLYLGGNEIKAMQNNVFKELINLQKLNLSSNKISKLPTGIFHGLKKLEILTLDNNAIRKIEKYAFRDLENLKELNLEHNVIVWTSAEMFDNTTQLTNLATDEYHLCCLMMKRNLSKCVPTVDECNSNELLNNTILKICVSVVGILTIIANFFVIIFRTKFNKFYTNKINSFLIRNLAISDLFMGFYLLIIVIADTVFTNYYDENDFEWRSSMWCHLAGTISTFSTSLTAFTLMIITIERVLVIISPFRTQVQEIYQVKISVIIAWLVALVIAIIPLPVFSIEYFENFYSRSRICLPLHISSNRLYGWHYSIFVFIVLYSIAFTIMLLSYIVMYLSTTKIRQAVNVSNEKSLQQMVMMMRMTLFVLADASCKIPVIILGVQSLSEDKISPIMYQWIAIFMTPLNAALNPILYTLSSLPSAFTFTEYLQSLRLRSPIIVKIKYRSPLYRKLRNQTNEIENENSDKRTRNYRRKKESK